jgi:AcrR family transcriptional regulator
MPRVTPDNRIPDIVQAAIRVLSLKGYRLTQMDEIAEQAKVSKATLYYYFKNKTHLFQYVLEHGGPNADASLPPPETTSSVSEKDLLQLLKKRLKEDTSLNSIKACMGVEPKRIDLANEIAAIAEELWDLTERNRVQIIILERSFLEFPELAEIFDTYARGRILKQLCDYLALRIKRGVIRAPHSVPVTARFVLESVAWFGKRAMGGPPSFSKIEALPDLISILVQGLKR